MKRRSFLFWVTAGIFGIGETLGIDLFDRVAAAAMRGGGRGGSSGPSTGSPSGISSTKAIGFNQPAQQSYQQANYNTVPLGPPVDDDPPFVDDPNHNGKVTAHRLARQGRPPSRWLRSLNTEELRVWLKSVNPGVTGVSGMTYATHLTRDHLFLADKIAGLNIDEQAKLHSAAHAGY